MRKIPRTRVWLIVFFFFFAFCAGWLGKVLAPEIVAVGTLKQPIYQGATQQKKVTLTFNVDWGEEFLPDILNILQVKNAKVTFMLTGRWAQKNPDLVSQIAQAGHEIGNHSYSHPHPNNLSRSELAEELNRTRIVLEEICAHTPSVFAPPYGEFNQRVLEVAEDLGYTVIMWTLDTVDWKRPPASVIVKKVTQSIQADYIVLMHPTEPTLEALPSILDYLQQEGYALVTASELIHEGGNNHP